MIRDNTLYNFNFNLYGTDALFLVSELSAMARLFHTQAEQATSEGEFNTASRLTDKALACDYVAMELSKRSLAIDVLLGGDNG